MKKTIILLIFSIVAFCCPVQAKHLNFMGIPLNGTITQFQQKLTAKGVSLNKTSSGILPVGVRVFKGTFAGEKADIYVYYDPTSKVVYRAKAVMTYATESICDSHYDKFKSMLSSKYPDAYYEEGYQDEHEAYQYYICSEENGEIKEIHGTIGIYVSQDDIFDFDERTLHIDYTDYINSLNNDDNRMEDL